MSAKASSRRASVRSKAIAAIEKQGALLVYPLANRKEPRSLWSELFPRTRMRWEWDQDGDTRVSDLWHLREELSRSNKVVYSKWFQGRATFFSFDVFVHLLSYLRAPEAARDPRRLGPESLGILELLLSDSPLSTRQIKSASELEGRLLEPTYNRAMKPLWQQLLIVGFGEFEDSSFPSLGVGATATLFEDLWKQAQRLPQAQAKAFLQRRLGEINPFWKYADKIGRSGMLESSPESSTEELT